MEFLTDDPVAQAVTYQRVTFDAGVTLRPLRLRYCRVCEPDLMVRRAGLRLRERCRDRGRRPVQRQSRDRIWVCEVTAAPAG